jgi:predicted RNA-binding protein with RPS1 domain
MLVDSVILLLCYLMQVRRVERYGVFVELSRSRVSGLVHVSASGLPGHVKEKDLAAAFSPGQAVKVRVLSVDASGGKVALSMQPELLVGSDDEAEDKEQQHGEWGDVQYPLCVQPQLQVGSNSEGDQPAAAAR